MPKRTAKFVSILNEDGRRQEIDIASIKVMADWTLEPSHPRTGLLTGGTGTDGKVLAVAGEDIATVRARIDSELGVGE